METYDALLASITPDTGETRTIFDPATGTAVGEAPVTDLDDIVRVLGSVWFAELTFWCGALTDAQAMADNLARAAALLLANPA